MNHASPLHSSTPLSNVIEALGPSIAENNLPGGSLTRPLPLAEADFYTLLDEMHRAGDFRHEDLHPTDHYRATIRHPNGKECIRVGILKNPLSGGALLLSWHTKPRDTQNSP